MGRQNLFVVKVDEDNRKIDFKHGKGYTVAESDSIVIRGEGVREVKVGFSIQLVSRKGKKKKDELFVIIREQSPEAILVQLVSKTIDKARGFSTENRPSRPSLLIKTDKATRRMFTVSYFLGKDEKILTFFPA